MIVAGPGFTRDDFLKWMFDHTSKTQDSLIQQNKGKFLSVHSSTAFKSSLNEILSDPSLKAQISNTKASHQVRALDEFYHILKSDPDRAVYGPSDVAKAASLGAILTLLLTDQLFRSATVKTRKYYVNMVQEMKAMGIEVRNVCY